MSGQEEDKHVTVVRNATDLQRLKLEKLMKNPEKLAFIPDRPKDKRFSDPAEFVRNVMGSSAGAGSGEFHVYRHIRRREYARQEFLQNCKEKDDLDAEYHVKLDENKRAVEEKAAKNRAKRRRQKERQRIKRQKLNEMKKKGIKPPDESSSEESSDDEEEEEEEEEEEKKAEVESKDESTVSKDREERTESHKESRIITDEGEEASAEKETREIQKQDDKEVAEK